MPPKSSSNDKSTTQLSYSASLKKLRDTEANEQNIKSLFSIYQDLTQAKDLRRKDSNTATVNIQSKLKEVALTVISNDKSQSATQCIDEILDRRNIDAIIKALETYQSGLKGFTLFNSRKKIITNLIAFYRQLNQALSKSPHNQRPIEKADSSTSDANDQDNPDLYGMDTSNIPADVLEEIRMAQKRGNWQLAVALLESFHTADVIPEDIQLQRDNKALLDHSSENETKFQGWLYALTQLGHSEEEGLKILEFGDPNSDKDPYKDGQRNNFEDPVNCNLIDKAALLLIACPNSASSGDVRHGTIVDESYAVKLMAEAGAADPLSMEPLLPEYKLGESHAETRDPLQKKVNEFQAELEQFMQDAEKNYYTFLCPGMPINA